ATFGVGHTDTLDEAYRKAEKMDLNRFATRLDVVWSGLFEAISPNILQGQNTDADNYYVRAEMYKLNFSHAPLTIIYLSTHQDTPDMIGSLVVIFTTAHASGALTLEHNG
ncbi:hypothetical protein C8J57DRAFT_1014904, partial [Mycena rebaudengoi]